MYIKTRITYTIEEGSLTNIVNNLIWESFKILCLVQILFLFFFFVIRKVFWFYYCNCNCNVKSCELNVCRTKNQFFFQNMKP